MAVAVGLAVVAVVAVVGVLLGGQDASAPVQREVCARELTLRDEPAKGSATLATVPRGGTVLVVGTRGAWSQVRRDDGGEAWLLTEFLCP